MMNSLFNTPNVTLLLAVHNESQHITKCISSIIKQTYPVEKLEVIILDGQSTDGTYQIIKSLIKEHQNFRLVDNPQKVQSAAWNIGIELSQGEIIGIVSGHVTLAPDYVAKAVETLQRTGADLVGGTVRAVSTGKVGQAIAMAMSSPFGVGDARHRFTRVETETDTVFMGFCHRSLYDKLGKYNENLLFSDDDEFSYRLNKSGGRIICNPEIMSHYYSRSNLASLWLQYYRYGLWKVRVLQKHPRQMRLRQFVPLAFVLALIAGLFLALVSPWGWIALAALVGVYVLANLLASCMIADREGWRYLPLLPLAFATIHLSYGLGFLAGLFKFWNRWKK